MVRDLFELKAPEMNVPLGKVTVQLRNAKTGEIENEIKKTNYVNPQVLKIYEKLVAMYTNTGVISTDTYHLRQISRGLALTTADHAINTNEMFMKGDILAHALYNNTSVTANQSGSYNTTESYSQPGLYNTKHVYEFPTNVANGTFQSIYTGNFNKGGSYPVVKGLMFNLMTPIGVQLPNLNQNSNWNKTLENGYVIYGNNQQIAVVKIPTVTNTNFDTNIVDPDIFERKIFNVLNTYSSADMYNNFIYTCDSSAVIRRYDINSLSTNQLVGTLSIPSGYTLASNGGVMIDRINSYILHEVRTTTATGGLYTNKLAVFNIDTLAFIRFVDGIESSFSNPNDTIIPESRNSTISKDGDVYHIVKTGIGSTENLGNARTNAFYFESINHLAKPYHSTMGAKLGPWLTLMRFNNTTPILIYALPSFFSRVLLDEPVTKTEAQTMKITYEFTSEPFSLI